MTQEQDGEAIKYFFQASILLLAGLFIDKSLCQAWKNIIAVVLVLFFLPNSVFKLLSYYCESDIDISPPFGVNAAAWRAAIRKPKRGGEVIGQIERVAFFTSFLSGYYQLIGIWLAFKVASKWDVWQNVIRIPDELPNVNPLDYLRARRQLGSSTYQSFIRGTILNIMFAGLTYLLVIGLYPVLICLRYK